MKNSYYAILVEIVSLCNGAVQSGAIFRAYEDNVILYCHSLDSLFDSLLAVPDFSRRILAFFVFNHHSGWVLRSSLCNEEIRPINQRITKIKSKSL